MQVQKMLSFSLSGIGLIAVCIIVFSLWVPTKARLAEALIDLSWHKLVTDKTSVPPWPWADTRPVAKLVVERLDQSLVILKGVDPTSLAFSAGVMHRYARFDGHSPVVIAGHRDSHFSFLEDILMKDIISLTNEHGENHLYQVEELVIIDSSLNHFSLDDVDNSLVLITCYPFNALAAGGDLRYVVKAKRL